MVNIITLWLLNCISLRLANYFLNICNSFKEDSFIYIIYIYVGVYTYIKVCIERERGRERLLLFFLNPKITNSFCSFWKEMETTGQEITSQKNHVLVTIYHGKSHVFQLRCKAVVLQFVVNEDAWGFFCYLLQEKHY